MELETTMAQSIRVMDENARYDAACKRLLSEKIILAWIMRACVEEYSGCDVNEIAEKYIEGQPQISEVPVGPDETNAAVIRGMAGEDASLTEGVVTYDIRFLATAQVSGQLIRLIINVEAQADFYPGYPLITRGIYYCSRMISAQYGTEFTASRYGQIKKVYSIWICLDPPANRANTITSYSLAEKNLVGAVREPVRNYDLMTAVMICLGPSAEERDAGILKLLDTLLSSELPAEEKKQILSRDFAIPMTQTLETEVSLMCNLSKGVAEKAMKQGMEKGMEKGKEMGITEALLASIRNLMDSMNWSAEQAMSVLKVAEGEQAKYLTLLGRQ